jgi:hypothetical protein
MANPGPRAHTNKNTIQERLCFQNEILRCGPEQTKTLL